MIKKIRNILLEQNLDGIIITISDNFGKYESYTHENLLTKISGFTGSNGTIIIGKNKSAFFTDGRYITQAKNEINTTIFEIISNISEQDWCIENKISNLGYDPFVLNHFKYPNINMIAVKKFFDDYRKILKKNHISQIIEYDIQYSGKSTLEKLSEINFSTDFLLIISPESICWLLNIRGNDVPFNPVLLSYAIIDHKKRIYVFTENDINISRENIYFQPMNELESFIKNIKQYSIQLNIQNTPEWFLHHFEKITNKPDPCLKLRSIKNEIEQSKAKIIHIKDGVAIANFIYWLKHNNSEITEIAISDKLLELRQNDRDFITPSFATIAGFGENSAIIHYHPNSASNKTINNDNILLIDSGGHYLGGTTDITRTFHLGTPKAQHILCYTLILKGHIALANFTFPKNTKGIQIDAIARQFLWQYGLDYPHGTGHGVGNCLNVHEGPISISSALNSHNLEAGMIVSIEPGYYFEGEFGIRLENLYLIEDCKENLLCFKPLTMAVFEPNLIDFSLLNQNEKNWLFNYHKITINNITPYLNPNILSWLNKHYLENISS